MTSNDVEQDMTSARLLSFEFLPFTHKELLDKLYTYTREGRRLSGNVTHDAGNRMMKHEKGDRPCKYNDICVSTGNKYTSTIRSINAASHSIRMGFMSNCTYSALNFKGVNALAG